MNEFYKLEQNIKKVNNEIEKMRTHAIRQLFKNRIKVSFLFKVLEKIKKETNNYATIMPLYQDDVLNSPVKYFAGGDPIEHDICNHIVFIHRYNTILLDDEGKSVYQNDPKYIEFLVGQTLQQVSLRQFGSRNFIIYSHHNGDRYEFFPPVYSLNVLIEYLNYKSVDYLLNLFKKSQNDVLFAFLEGILRKAKGILCILNSKCLESGYPILRGVIELYITFLCLKYSSMDYKVYLRFLNYKLYYDENLIFDPDFEKEYKAYGNNISKIDYLNYGWLDSLFEFNYLTIKKQYKFIDLLNLADFITKRDKNINQIVMDLRKYYYKCHIYTHGTPILNNHLIHLSDICIPLTDIIVGICYEIQKKFNIEVMNGINLIKFVTDSNNDLKEKLKNINNMPLPF